ncbi:MAG: DNA polymerase Y family protein [Gemmatimonadota bacterium]
MSSSRTSVCLWLPTFELRLELVRTPELDTTSVALLSPGSSGGRGEIQQLSERAAEAGVRPGMRVSQAISLCPSLTLLEPDPAHYAAATNDILEVLEGVSPVVQSTDPGIFHVGVDGLERLYGSAQAQVDRILHALLEVLPRPLVAAVRVGRAPGCFGARVAAAAARPGVPVLVEEEELASFLAPCPISVLPVPEEMLAQLERLDITTMGELGALPLPALLRHFGPPGREALALARGERVDAVSPLHRPRPIRVSLDFPTPVGDRETLHRGIERLLERGLARPERKDRSVRGIRVGGVLEGGGSWEVSVTLREPSAKRETLAFPLRQRTLLSPPPRAIETLFVELFDFGTPILQNDLFGRQEEGGRTAWEASLATGRISQALKEAVRELTLKLGHTPLYRVVEVDPWSRIPERRHALLGVEGH